MSYESTIHDDVLDMLRRRARLLLSEADRVRETAQLAIEAVGELKEARAEVRKLRVLLKRARPILRAVAARDQPTLNTDHLLAELEVYFDARRDVRPGGNVGEGAGELQVVGHPPGERFVMVLSDEMAEERTVEQMDTLVDNLRSAAGYLGFDIQMWGYERAVTERLSAHAHSVLTTARELFAKTPGA